MTLHAPSFTIASAAKINLALHITGQREDGYHLLHSLVAFTDIGDLLHVATAPDHDFRIEGPFGESLPLDAGNLVVRAREKLLTLYPGLRTLRLSLEKNLPVASGIGGGSGNAAAALRAYQTLHPEVETAHVETIARSLGADVPMCLAQVPAIASGIGEELVAIKNLPVLHIVMVNPGIEISTPAVYRALSSKVNPPLSPLPDDLALGSFLDWLGEQRNDLQAPALEIAPGIAPCLVALRDGGARLARMSGSGATCFGIFSTADEARQTADAIALANPTWWVRAARTLDD
ncbi:4-(cytidine 5'-diphospho)-2-C-methyl-D-erythritol kinase [Limoniibacter endophyticus]|uniref:4-diphosphocytidyl-2-C-methyl-D-erythritol kinase n=1 Tax=Limoniibacter endophyticus TaxID=1565040 RepID=A0A8J3DNM2_9HYPH|nr:4-(cytidine 5'-diphospho)-2-C-methyl-D-erythritol kinase [Limoniibacter endophyticus]GHC71319.1 4-diphosphocytidyl-2-C-methyl-D-erythritol kinase [Limoniibacter endophyticus]